MTTIADYTQRLAELAYDAATNSLEIGEIVSHVASTKLFADAGYTSLSRWLDSELPQLHKATAYLMRKIFNSPMVANAYHDLGQMKAKALVQSKQTITSEDVDWAIGATAKDVRQRFGNASKITATIGESATDYGNLDIDALRQEKEMLIKRIMEIDRLIMLATQAKAA